MPWPPSTELPTRPINRWDVHHVAAGERLPAARLPLPDDCLRSHSPLPNWQQRTTRGDGALKALFDVDLTSAVDIVRFVSEYSGIRHDVWLHVEYLAEDELHPLTLGPPPTWGEHRDAAVASGGRDQFANEERFVAFLVETWVDRWIGFGEWSARAALYDPEILCRVPSHSAGFDEAHDRATEMFGIDESAFTIPLSFVVFDLRLLRVHLSAMLLALPSADPAIHELLLREVRGLVDEHALDALLVERHGDEYLFTSLLRRAARASERTLRTYQPYLVEPPLSSYFWTVENFLWVELFNDINRGFAPKVCANPDCQSPFTRQIGQSHHRQSRRDARACSKACADRISYVRRRHSRN